MNYTKPHLAVLGAASRVIEQIPTQKNVAGPCDGALRVCFNPAYDLDE
jgi:hypothetical protein